jgi:hypothetical protein
LILNAYKATPDFTLAKLHALLADHGTKVALARYGGSSRGAGSHEKKTVRATEQIAPTS